MTDSSRMVVIAAYEATTNSAIDGLSGTLGL